VTPAWIGGGISIEPRSEAVPHLWHWRDLRPQAMRAAQLVGTHQAERRVLRLTNPKLPGVASNTLVANIQIVMPGEIARAPSSFRGGPSPNHSTTPTTPMRR
jgi:gentisate 1,2-dioxygenase